MTETILIIGAGGGIGRELVSAHIKAGHAVHAISRGSLGASSDNSLLTEYQVDSCNEQEVIEFVTDMKKRNVQFDKVFCTVGVLHQKDTQTTASETNEGNVSTLKPEKRLEDINRTQLQEYFSVNSIIPAIWLKHLVKVANKNQAHLVFFSARVGSINENELGGRYGYRASKAALNMLVKTASIEYKRRCKNAILSCYHPGTVDTSLSAPFQANVKPEKLFTPEFTVQQLIKHLNDLTVEDSPYYFDWNGQTITY